MSDGENRPEKHRGLREPWQPGQSGNPAGRPKGSRNKLGEQFLADLFADWTAAEEAHGTNGAAVIAKVRADDPVAYLRVVAAILPKQLDINPSAFDDLTDDQLTALIAFARNALGPAQTRGDGTGATIN